jgi:type II secretory pathway pseudopilin PulG
VLKTGVAGADPVCDQEGTGVTRHARPRCRDAADEGFTLVEAMVAAAIMVVFVLALSTVLVSELGASKIDRQRVSASTLAAREQDIVRNQFSSSVANATVIAGQTMVVNPDPLTGAAGTASLLNGTSFTVERDTEWLPTGNGASACDGGSLVTFPSLRVHVEVTWPGMGAVPPVVSDTVLTPPKNMNNANVGYLAVKVVDRNGSPNVSRNVTATGPGGTQTGATDTSGCATFQFGTAGTYTISLSEPGYVDMYGVASPSKQQALTISSLNRLTMTYDRAASIQATFTPTTGFSLPVSMPAITIANSGLQTNAQHTEDFPAVAGGGATTMGSLWPFASGYTIWPGGCLDADPASSPTNGTRNAAVSTDPGITSVVSVPMAPLLVTVTHGNGTVAPNVSVTATSQSTGCLAPEQTLTLGTSDATGTLHTSLPYGSWKLTASGGVAGSAFHPVTTGVTSMTAQVP